MVQPLWKTVWKFLRKLKIELPFDLAIPLLGIYPEKTMTQNDTCSPVFGAAPYLQQGRHVISLNTHQQRSGSRRCGTYILSH